VIAVRVAKMFGLYELERLEMREMTGKTIGWFCIQFQLIRINRKLQRLFCESMSVA